MLGGRLDAMLPARRASHPLHRGHAVPFPAVWSYGAPLCLGLLIVAAGLDGITTRIHGLSVYPENIALGIVVLWAAAATAVGQMRWYRPAAFVPLLFWIASELLATLLYAPDRHASLVLWAKLPLVVATYLLAANLARGRIRVAATTQVLTAAGVAVVAIGAYISWKLTGSHLGMQHPGRNFGRGWLPAATLREPDILGSYLVAALLLAAPATLVLRRTRSRFHVAAWAVMALLAAGIVVSGARTAWLALIAGLMVPLAVAAVRSPRVAVRRALLPLLFGTAAVAALFALHVNPTAALPAFHPHDSGTLVQRVASFGSLSRDRNVVARIQIDRNALDHWRTHPLTGWGVGAYGEVYTYPPPDTIHTGWIANLPIHLLYDSGLLGLAAFTWAMARAVLRGLRSWFSASGLSAAVLAGILLALFALLVAFQATEATWFAYPWIYLGLLEAAACSISASRTLAPEIAR